MILWAGRDLRDHHISLFDINAPKSDHHNCYYRKNGEDRLSFFFHLQTPSIFKLSDQGCKTHACAYQINNVGKYYYPCNCECCLKCLFSHCHILSSLAPKRALYVVILCILTIRFIWVLCSIVPYYLSKLKELPLIIAYIILSK